MCQFEKNVKIMNSAFMVILVHAPLVAVKKEDAFKISNVYRAVDMEHASSVVD